MDLSSKTLRELYKLDNKIRWEMTRRISPALLIIFIIIITVSIIITIINKRRK